MSNRQCYYPNGDLTKEVDIPCGTGNGVACCPEKWTCQSNGLCFNPAENYYGRYTCTDKTWNSPGCPQICTYVKTAGGNEALLDCGTNQWCCDTNRPEPGCCDTTKSRFALDSRKIQLPLGGANSASSSPSSSSSSSSPKQQQQQGTSLTTPTPTQTVQTSLITSVSSNSAQGLVTVVVTSQVTTFASSTSLPSSHSHSSGPSAKVLAPAIVAPILGLSLLLFLLFFLLRRRKKKKGPLVYTNGNGPNGVGAVPMYKSQEEVSPFSGYSGSELEGCSPTRSSHRYNAPSDIRASTLTSPDVGAGTLGVLGGGEEKLGRSPLRESFVSELPSQESGKNRASGLGIVGEEKVGEAGKEAPPVAELSATKSVQRRSRLGV